MIDASEAEQALREALAHARRRMAVQDAIAETLAAAIDLDEAVPRILSVVCVQLGWVVGALWMQDPASGQLHCTHLWHDPSDAVDPFTELTRGLALAPGNGLPGRVWEARQAAWFRDVSQEAGIQRREAAAAAGLRAAIAFPIESRGTPLGVMEFFGRAANEPDEDLLVMLRSVGRQIGQFIRRTRAEEERQDLLEREQTSRMEAEAAQARLTILAEAGDRLAATIGFEGTLREVAWLMLPALADWSAIDIVESDGSLRRVAAAHPDPAHADRLMAMQPSRQADDDRLHMVARVLRTGRPWSLTHITASHLEAVAGSAEEAQMLRELRPGSAMAVPLAARGRTLGVLSVASKAPERYTADDLALAVNLARRCALAIDNARLLLEAQQEIARRQQAEQAMQTSLDQLDAILRGVTDGITVQKPTGELVYANDAAAATLGFSSADELLKSATAEVVRRFAILDDGGRPLDLSLLPGRRALAGEQVMGVPLRFRVLASGEERWSMVAASPVRDEAGAVRFAVNIFHDITDQKRTEERLRFLADAGALLPTSLDVEEALTGIVRLAVATLADWSVVYLLGDGEAISHMVVAHVDPAQEDRARELLRRYPPIPDDASVGWRVLRTRDPLLLADVPDELLVRAARDPEHLQLLRELNTRSALWLPLIARGRMLGALGMFTTVSGRRFAPADQAVGAEIARRAALAVDNARLYLEAQDAIRARDRFLSIASHELKTPVAGIKVAAQMLLRAQARGMLEADRLSRALRTIDETAARLGQLTDDLLDVARLRLGQLSMDVRPLDIGELVTEAATRFRDRIDEQEGLRLDLDIAAEAYIVDGDELRLQQVLANLLDNALKYSPRGGSIQLALRPDADGYLLTVRDQGIGLPEDSRERIFEPFGRAPNAERQHLPGLGLGLYICRNIVERHGGRIWAESPGDDQGTAFMVWLPERSNGGERGPGGEAQPPSSSERGFGGEAPE